MFLRFDGLEIGRNASKFPAAIPAGRGSSAAPVLLAVICACSASAPIAEAGPTAPPLASPAPIVCATDGRSASIDQPEATRILAVGIDRAVDDGLPHRPSYDPWWLLPETAITRTRDLLGDVDLRPGDAVLGSWITSDSHDPKEIWAEFARVPAAPAPDLPPRPTLPPRPLNGLGNAEHERAIERYCMALSQWLADVAKAQADHETRQGKLTAAFVNARKTSLDALQPRPVYGPTDVMAFFAKIADLARAYPRERVIAVVATDLADRRVTTIEPDFRLGIVDVVVVLFRRADPAEERAARQEWEQRLRAFGARRVVILGWDVSTPSKICAEVKEVPTCP